MKEMVTFLSTRKSEK